MSLSSELVEQQPAARPLSRSIREGSVDQRETGIHNEVVRAPLIGTRNALSVSGGQDLRAYFEVPFKYKILILRCLLACLIIGWLVLLLWPRTYESEAKLIIRVGRESVSLDPTATTSQTLMLQKTQEEEINSALEVLSSRQVAEQAVAVLGAENVLEGILPVEGTSSPSWFESATQTTKRTVSDAAFYAMRFAGLKDDISDHELAVRRLQSQVDIFAPKKSTVITIHAESKTPEMAQAVAQEVINGFLDQHLKVSRTSGSKDFFLSQSEHVETKLNQLVKQRSDYMQERKIVSIDANRALLKDQLAAIDRDVLLARGELEQAVAEADDISDKLETTEDEIVAGKQEGSDLTWSGMRQRVYELELQEKRFAAMYTEDHQLLVQTREQLDGAQKILDELEKNRVDSNRTPNPAKRRMLDDLQRQQTKVAGLYSILEEKGKQKQETEQQVNDLLQYERELMEMDREIGLNETSLYVLREKLEEARVIEELQAKRISNVSVFQPATFVERAVSPKKRILAAGFLVLGLMSGFGLAYLKTMTKTCVTSAVQLETQTGLPVCELPWSPKLENLQSPSPALSDNSIRTQAVQILNAAMLSRPRRSEQGYSLGIVSAESGGGTTTLAMSLALVASQECSLNAILVDTDAKRKKLSKLLGLKSAPGITDLLSGEATREECLQSGQANLAVVSSSSSQSNKHLSTSPDEVASVLSTYQTQCDLLIVDLPAADRPDPVTGLTRYLDGILLVAESEKTEQSAIDRLLARLETNDTEVVGIVLNKSREYLPSWLSNLVASKS